MKHVKLTVLSATVYLSVIGSAQAATVLQTAPYGFAHSSNHHYHCGILNVGKKAATVTIDTVDSTGTVVDTTGSFTLDAGHTSNFNGSGLSGTAADHCRFTVSGSAKSFRAGFFQEDANDYLTVFVPAN